MLMSLSKVSPLFESLGIAGEFGVRLEIILGSCCVITLSLYF